MEVSHTSVTSAGWYPGVLTLLMLQQRVSSDVDTDAVRAITDPQPQPGGAAALTASGRTPSELRLVRSNEQLTDNEKRHIICSLCRI